MNPTCISSWISETSHHVDKTNAISVGSFEDESFLFIEMKRFECWVRHVTLLRHINNNAQIVYIRITLGGENLLHSKV